MPLTLKPGIRLHLPQFPTTPPASLYWLDPDTGIGWTYQTTTDTWTPIIPSLDLNFAGTKSLRDGISGRDLVTFSRTSNATFVDSNGVIQTAPAGTPRFDHNPTTGESLGLLVEEQRQNLLLNSATLSTQNVTVTAVAHTLSFTGTGTITLSGTSTAGPLVGTGTGEANRVSLTFTPTAGTLTLTVSGTVTNAQLEIGEFRTSWIPTTGSAATRNADVVSITGTNFSSWYRQSEGSFLFDGRFNTVAFQNAIFSVTNSASPTANQHSIRIGNSIVTSGGVQVANFFQTPVLQAVAKYGYGYAADNFCQVLNSTTIATDTSGALPVGLNTMEIGKVENTQIYSNVHIRRLTYWTARLPNATLQALTV